jgi:indolepyruvate decarboxylase
MDIAQALVESLVQRGVRRVYGVPGDYVLGLFDRFEQSPIEMVCTAGRRGLALPPMPMPASMAWGDCGDLRGGSLEICSIPWRVPMPKRSPLLVISGAPGVRESDGHALLHHSIRSSDTQQRFFNEVCAETARLDSGRTAAGDITKVLDAMQRESRPGYPGTASGLPERRLPWPLGPLAAPAATPEPSPLHQERGEAVLNWLRSRQRPVVLAGIELHRFGLQQDLLALLEREGWPFATSLSAKSLLNERHPLRLGSTKGRQAPPTCANR